MSDSSQEYPSRYEDGYEDGYGEGYDVGHSTGYAKGYEDGRKRSPKVDDILDVFDLFFYDLLYVVDENNGKGYTSSEIRKEFQRWYLDKNSEIQESLEKLEQGYRPWEK